MNIVSFILFTIRIASPKVPIVFFIISIALFFQGCGGNTIFFEQTCVECVTSQWMSTQSMCSDTSNAPRIMKGGIKGGFYTMIPETGEIIDLGDILLGEGIISEDSDDISSVYGKPIAIAKFKGKYYLTGDDFNFLWILTPAGQNQASIDQIPLPKADRVKKPVFTINTSKGRFDPVLILSAANYPDYYLDSENEWKEKF